MRKAIKGIIFFALLLFALFYIKTDYFLILPGTAEDLSRMVHVPGMEEEAQEGFYMVTVMQQPANLALYLYGTIHPDIDLRPAQQMIPPDMSEEEYRDLMQSWMRDSKLLAQVIALRRAGYEVEIISDGVEVVDFLDGSPAKDFLAQGDVITSIDGAEVNLAEEVVTLVQSREVGDDVTVNVNREEINHEYTIETISHNEEPDKPALGVYVRTLAWEPVLPMEINIETGAIYGPSAGMMFVLEILNQLLPEDISGGRKIAGTGTINLDEEVGSIGGVKQKVVAAEKIGADYFLAPQTNYQEAQNAARDINVISVETLDDALDFFQEITDDNEEKAVSNYNNSGFRSYYRLPAPSAAEKSDPTAQFWK